MLSPRCILAMDIKKEDDGGGMKKHGIQIDEQQ
jgi:hypothetical protein